MEQKIDIETVKHISYLMARKQAEVRKKFAEADDKLQVEYLTGQVSICDSVNVSLAKMLNPEYCKECEGPCQRKGAFDNDADD